MSNVLDSPRTDECLGRLPTSPSKGDIGWVGFKRVQQWLNWLNGLFRTECFEPMWIGFIPGQQHSSHHSHCIMELTWHGAFFMVLNVLTWIFRTVKLPPEAFLHALLTVAPGILGPWRSSHSALDVAWQRPNMRRSHHVQRSCRMDCT